MKITYDKRADALNVSLRPGTVARTIEVTPEILVDVDRQGRMLNLEVLGACEKIGAKNFSTVHIGNTSVPLPSLA